MDTLDTMAMLMFAIDFILAILATPLVFYLIFFS